MPPSTPSYLRTRSITPSTHLSRPNPSSINEHINISSVDTPTFALRDEILVGFLPVPPSSLITLSRPRKHDNRSCDVGLWNFHPGRPVELYQRLQVKEDLEYLPVAMASTVYDSVYERIFQGVYRSANDDGEGCIEIRSMDLSSQDIWNVWESVTEEDGVFGGVCWSLLHKGYILISTASRVYFFLATPAKRRCEENYWTQGKRCLIFEVDIFLQWVLPDGNWKYATRIFGAKDGNITILVFVSQKTQLESFRLDVCPNTLQVTIGARTGIVTWKSGAKGALIAWSMGRKLMTAHLASSPVVMEISRVH